MSLACIYGGHECDGCLECEDREDRFDVYDRADEEYDRLRDYEYDMYIDSLE